MTGNVNLLSPQSQLNVRMGFFFAGLLNNMSYCIVLAGAKDIAADMVGIVFIASTLPSIVVKLSGPYWFHFFSYKARATFVTISFVVSFVLIGLFVGVSQGLCFLGIVAGAFGSAIGEASFLALSSFYAKPRTCITMWSSGTGFSGVLGYGWYVMFTEGFNASFSTSCLVANTVALGYYFNFVYLLGNPKLEREVESAPLVFGPKSTSSGTDSNSVNANNGNGQIDTLVNNPLVKSEVDHMAGSRTSPYAARGKDDDSKNLETSVVNMSFKERFHHSLGLWPYVVPLFIVYFSEYAMQSGTWAAIGFPVDDQDARKLFYEYANWTYQFGVLISRSSGTWFKLSMMHLWVMPILQFILLLFFLMDAFYQFWYDWGLIVLCLFAGLMGGACYVHGFSLLSESCEPSLREFSLSAASVGDSFGVILGDTAGIFIQQAIYNKHNLNDDDL